LPSLDTEIVAFPTALAVTSPALDTVALVVSDELHSRSRPDSVCPALSFNVAVSCWVAPMARVAVAGLTVTEATGTKRVIVAVADLPSLVAVIVALPTARAVTSPVLETTALVVSDELQVTVRPVRVPPALSFNVAVSCWVAPMARVAVAGLTVTEATGTSTVRLALLDFPSTAAVSVTVPALRGSSLTVEILVVGWAKGAPSILATVVSDKVHVTVRSVSEFPAASRTRAPYSQVSLV